MKSIHLLTFITGVSLALVLLNVQFVKPIMMVDVIIPQDLLAKATPAETSHISKELSEYSSVDQLVSWCASIAMITLGAAGIFLQRPNNKPKN